jgi:L-amino acid N-acyltransferase YncA
MFPMYSDETFILRTPVSPEDFREIHRLQCLVTIEEHGVEQTIVPGGPCPVPDFVLSASPRERVWAAEQAGQIVGCIAVAAASPQTAEFRWFVVDPKLCRKGLGERLLAEAIAFCSECGYKEVIVWTENARTAVARLCRRAGFKKVEGLPCGLWDRALVEQKYELKLS